MYTELRLKLVTKTFINPNTAPYILVHPCKFHNPFLNTKLSHFRSDRFLRNLVGRLLLVHESHINLFAHREKFLLHLADDKGCICCASSWEEPKLLFVNSHHLSNEAVGNSLNDFHSLRRQFLSSKVASVQRISPFSL